MKPIKYILIRNREGKLELRCSYCCYHRNLLRKDDIFSPLGGGVVEVFFDEEKSKSPETVFEMVFHPNGNLNGGWVDNEDILLGYEKDLY